MNHDNNNENIYENNNENNNEIINQALNDNSEMLSLNILMKIGNSICKIKIRNKLGTGFFIKLEKGNKEIYCLMTNEHVIKKTMIKDKETIEIFYENQDQKFIIKLDEKRFIRDYKYMNIDSTLIEILPEDKIEKKLFLLPNIEYQKGFYQFTNINIFIPQFPFGGELKLSYGEIIDINENSFVFSYNASTQIGSSGSPILIKDSTYILGIHKQGSKTKNYGNFIGPIIDSLKNDYQYDIKDYDDGKYEGELKDGKKEGYGKFIWTNGEYYIGQWVNDEREGKGILYYNNNKIKYEGEFKKNEFNGYGKYYLENKEYYIGYFKNNEYNGKGVYYNGKKEIIYDGEYANGKKEGKGIFYYKKDTYYKGYYKNDI